MAMFQKLIPPSTGAKITLGADGKLAVPDQPVVLFVEGDGVGPEAWAAARQVLDAAVAKTYGGQRRIQWFEVYAGEKCNAIYGPDTWLPEDTLAAFREYRVGIKGPLTTPVGGGRALHQRGPAPAAGSLRLPAPGAVVPGRALAREEAPSHRHGHLPGEHRGHLRRHRMGRGHPRGRQGPGLPGAGDGREEDPLPELLQPRHQARERGGLQAPGAGGHPLCPPAPTAQPHPGAQGQHHEVHGRGLPASGATRRRRRPSATAPWPGPTAEGKAPAGKLLVKDVIADNFLQQILIKPADYDVVATTNLNGDYISDALAAQVGGLGIAPGRQHQL